MKRRLGLVFIALQTTLALSARAQEELPAPPPTRRPTLPPVEKVVEPPVVPPANPRIPKQEDPADPNAPVAAPAPGTRPAPTVPLVATPFARDEWKIRVERDADGAITNLSWRNKNTGDGVAALTDEALEILTRSGKAARLVTDDAISHAILILPSESELEGGVGLNGATLVLTAEKPVPSTGVLQRSPLKVALAPNGFYFALVEGAKIHVRFFSLDEADPVKQVETLTTESFVKFTEGDTRIDLTANGATIFKEGESHIYRPRGKKGQSGLVYSDLTPSNIDVIEGTYGAIDLVKAAKEGRLDPDESQEETLKRVVRNFSSNRQKVSLLWGESGVETRGAVDLLAYKIAKNQLPELKGWRVYEVNYTRFGTEMYVDLTLKKVVEFMKACEQKKVILFLPDAHSFVGLGTGDGSSGKTNDAGLAMASFLKTGNVLAIATSSDGSDGVGRLRESGGAFFATMLPMRLEEADKETIFKTVRAAADRRQEEFRVVISDVMVKRAIDLTNQHLYETRQPTKSLQLIASVAQANAPEDYENPQTKPVAITERMMLQYMTEIAGIKTLALAKDPNAGINKLIKSPDSFRKRMHEEMVGQEDALEAVRKAMLRIMYGGSQRDGQGAEQGVQILLFTGPSGVGKSFTPQVLENVLAQDDIGLKWKRKIYEGTSLQSENSESTIGGSRPGFVGFKEGGGSLYSFVRDNPQGMVVFEEIDKIHEKTMLSLYKFIEHGIAIDDNTSNEARMKRGIIFLTSNFGSIKGAKLYDKKTTGYADSKSNDMIDRWDRHFIFGIKDPEMETWGFDEKLAKATTEEEKTVILAEAEEKLKTDLLLKLMEFKVLNPQIVGRIGPPNIILFHHFNKREITQVRDLLLKKSERPYLERNVTFEFSQPLKDWLIDKAWGKDGELTFNMGARAVEQYIKSEVETALAQFASDNEENADAVNDKTWCIDYKDRQVTVAVKQGDKCFE